VTITLPWEATIPPKALRLAPGAAPPKVVRVESKWQVVVPDFDIAEAIAVTTDSATQERIIAHQKKTLPMMASAAVAALTDKMLKTETVCRWLGERVSRDLRQRLTAGRQGQDEALRALGAGQYLQAYRRARETMWVYRAVQGELMRSAEEYAERHSVPTAHRTRLNIFFSLPLFYAELGAGQAPPRGELRKSILEAWKSQQIPLWERM